MIAVYLSPVFLLILFWACNRWHKLIDVLKIKSKAQRILFKSLFWLCLVFTAFIVIGFLLQPGHLKNFFSRLGAYWLGISLYLFLGLAFGELVRVIYKKLSKERYNDKLSRICCFAFVFLFTIGMSVYGIVNAKTVRTTEYEIHVNKKSDRDELRIALIADTHFGYNIGTYHLQKAVDIINDADVDLVCLAGDIFDNDYEAIDDPDALIELFHSIKSKYGTYAVLGNHDVEERILCGFTFDHKADKYASEGMLGFIEKSGMKLLYDEYVLLDDFYVYGRPDYERLNFGKSTRVAPEDVTKGMDQDKLILCIDHEPREYEGLMAAGVDIDLCGHTHDGQIWPTKYLTYLVWENAYGLWQSGDFSAVTTSGLGLFGPNMRTATISEVCIITVKFDK